VGQLEPGQRAVFVDRLGHQGQGRDVAIVPEPRLGGRPDVAAWVDLAFLGTDHAPAALGLDPAHGGGGARQAVAHAIAVRYHRTDPDRLEENVVSRVPRHCLPPL
jgi:NADPH:quinone reductase-like Zn-dependent oxidoreductase